MKRLFNSKASLLLAGALICMLLLSACVTSNSSSNSTSSSTIPAVPIKIGVSLSLTGDDLADGQATQQGYNVWAAYVNSHGGLLGHQVQMVYYDDGTKTDQTRANYEKLITVDKVNFVIGPFDDPQTITRSRGRGPASHGLCGGYWYRCPEVFQHGLTNLFAVSLSATAYFTSFVNYILSLPTQLRPLTAAYATSDDGFTEPQITHAQTLLEQGGIKTALSYTYSAENADPPPAQKVVNSHADIVLLGTLGLQDCAAFIKTFEQQHYNPKLIIASAWP